MNTCRIRFLSLAGRAHVKCGISWHCYFSYVVYIHVKPSATGTLQAFASVQHMRRYQSSCVRKSTDDSHLAASCPAARASRLHSSSLGLREQLRPTCRPARNPIRHQSSLYICRASSRSLTLPPRLLATPSAYAEACAAFCSTSPCAAWSRPAASMSELPTAAPYVSLMSVRRRRSA